MTDELNLSANQLDALREIGNVGAGNSATALSQVINRRIDMNVPKVALVPLEAVPDLVGGPNAVVVGIFLRVYGKAPSNILFLLPQKSAFYLVDTLMGKPHGSTTKLEFMDESALMEIGNILSGAYLNAFFTFTKITMLPQAYRVGQMTDLDVGGTMISEISSEWGAWSNFRTVSFAGCTKLRRLPENLDSRSKIRFIDLSDTPIAKDKDEIARIRRAIGDKATIIY